jgi:hypothetical protein
MRWRLRRGRVRIVRESSRLAAVKVGGSREGLRVIGRLSGRGRDRVLESMLIPGERTRGGLRDIVR